MERHYVDGELVKVKEGETTMVDFDELEQKIDEVSGNPEVVDVLQCIVEYIRKEV